MKVNYLEIKHAHPNNPFKSGEFNVYYDDYYIGQIVAGPYKDYFMHKDETSHDGVTCELFTHGKFWGTRFAQMQEWIDTCSDAGDLIDTDW